jgi:NAD-reducing hydrogenase large subunit
LNAVVDGGRPQVLVWRDARGQVARARFDLTGLPRVESVLIGRPVAEVPALVERLCGICPAAHHLAGVRALEALTGGVTLSAEAERMRRLLHYGAVLQTHAFHWLPTQPQAAMVLGKYAKTVLAAAGSPGHFPATAIVGGVTAALTDAGRAAVLAGAAAAFAALQQIPASEPTPVTPHFLNVGLATADGTPDLFGTHLRAVTDTGEVVANTTALAIAEAEPGSPAPRPYLRDLGPSDGQYRVGPHAQVSLGELSTEQAAQLQGRAEPRVVIALHCLEMITRLADQAPTPTASPQVGWVDSARGLLVHHYQADAAGQLTAAVILTPTAQNEPWLAALLTEALQTGGDLEAAVRLADPCLPCTAALPGQMNLELIEAR